MACPPSITTRSPLAVSCTLKTKPNSSAYSTNTSPTTAPSARTKSTYSPKPSTPKQQCIWLAETAHLEVTIAQNERDFRKTLPNANAPAHLANAISKSGDELKLYLRYDAQLHRHYRNCLKDLRDLQDRRAAQPPEAPPAPIEPKPPAETTPKPPEKQATPNQPKLTPEEIRQQAEKAKIRRLMEVNLGLRPVTPEDLLP